MNTANKSFKRVAEFE